MPHSLASPGKRFVEGRRHILNKWSTCSKRDNPRLNRSAIVVPIGRCGRLPLGDRPAFRETSAVHDEIAVNRIDDLWTATERLRALEEAAPVGIVALDRDGRITIW